MKRAVPRSKACHAAAGCRSPPDQDYVYAAELKAFANERLVDLNVDFSRAGETISAPYSGMGPLPYRSKACAACGEAEERSGPDLRDRHEAPRQDGRGSLPDRRRRRARFAALSCRMGARRALCARRTRHSRSADDPGEALLEGARGRVLTRRLR